MKSMQEQSKKMPTSRLKHLVTPEIVDKAVDKLNEQKEFAVEGGRYVIIKEAMYPEVITFLTTQFVPDEPCCSSSGILSEQEVSDLFMPTISQNMSLALVSTAADETKTDKIKPGEIMSLRLFGISNKADKTDLAALSSDALRQLFDLLGRLEVICNTFEHFQVEDTVHFFGLGSSRELRRAGLGKKVLQAAIGLVKNMGLKGFVVEGEGTGKFSQRIYEELGFETLAEVKYADYKVNGEIYYKNTGQHTSIKSYGKIFW